MKANVAGFLALLLSVVALVNSACVPLPLEQRGVGRPGSPGYGLGSPAVDAIDPNLVLGTTPRLASAGVPVRTPFSEQVLGNEYPYCVSPCIDIPCRYYRNDDFLGFVEVTKYLMACGTEEQVTAFLTCVNDTTCNNCLEELYEATGLNAAELAQEISDFPDNFGSEPAGFEPVYFSAEDYERAAARAGHPKYSSRAERALVLGGRYASLYNAEKAARRALNGGGRRLAQANTDVDTDVDTDVETPEFYFTDSELNSTYATLLANKDIVMNAQVSFAQSVTIERTARATIRIQSDFYLCRTSATACIVGFGLNDASTPSHYQFMVVPSCVIANDPTFQSNIYRFTSTHTVTRATAGQIYTASFLYYCSGEKAVDSQVSGSTPIVRALPDRAEPAMIITVTQ